MSKLLTSRVIEWNAARYDRIYDYDLARKLLIEEMTELSEATSVIEKLDAIGDIMFVAIGVFWKLGFKEEIIAAMFYHHNLRNITLDEADWHMLEIQTMSFDLIDSSVEGAWPGLNMALFYVFSVCLVQLKLMGKQERIYDILEAICDSNDTKEVKGKTDPSIKANIEKGNSYVPPTIRLKQIAEGA